ncbi:MAG: DMT family transporter [Arenicellales bacterium]
MIQGQQQNGRGIVLVISAMTIFSVQDVIIKLLSDDVSLYQILFFRSLIGILLILGFQKIIGEPIKLWTAYPGLSLYRGIAFFFGYAAFYFAQSKVPIANATVLFLVSPFFITIMSIFVFGSSVGVRRWAAMLVGFSGVIFIARPEAGAFNWIYLLPVTVAVLYATSMMIAKKTAERDTVYQQIIVMYLVTTVLSGLMGLFFGDGSLSALGINGIEFLTHPWRLDGLDVTLPLLLITLIGTSGFLLLHSAYRIADPAVISPYEYSGLAAVMILAFAVFGDIPSALEATGMVLIVGAGIYLFYRERVQGQDAAAEATLR